METPEQEYVEVVIKDFNVPALNGNMYSIDANSTKLAIQKFIEKQQAAGELNHPKMDDPDMEKNVARISVIDESNIAVHMTDLRYDEDKKQIIGKIKPVPTVYKNLLEDLDKGAVRFGMRSLCHAHIEDGQVKHDVIDIITFDIINAVPSEK